MQQSNTAEIDVTDYAILKCLSENGGCWKKQIHAWITEHNAILPGMKEKSVQTIGRRVDDLQEHGVVETCILNPDTLNRDMVIGYKLSEAGRDVMAAKRRKILQNQVIQSSEILLGSDSDLPINRDALIELLVDEFAMDDASRTLLEQLDTNDILAVLAVHSFLGHVDETVNTDNEDILTELLRETPELGAPLASDNVISRIRDRLLTAPDTTDADTRTADTADQPDQYRSQ